MSRATLFAHQAACRACHACVDDGIIPEANPTFEGEWGARFFLVGQAPGPTERISRRPFSGRAGKELDRWMLRAGFASPEEFRKLTYVAALMRCFPGRNATGTGDLRPPPAAIASCAHWLETELRILKPRVVIPVGQMAINRFLGPGSLEDRVGHRYGERPIIVPLPHPSGTSRWLNVPANRERLAAALLLIAELRAQQLAWNTPVSDSRGEGSVKYVLVYYGGGMPQGAAAQARALRQWEKWFAKVGPDMVDGGNPMSGAVNKIRANGSVAKGPIGKRATGYSIIEAPSLDKATKLAKGCPILKGGGEIAVYETFNAM